MGKPKISSDWLAGCSGCHMSLLDIDERIAKVVELADLRAMPITDLKEPDESGCGCRYSGRRGKQHNQ